MAPKNTKLVPLLSPSMTFCLNQGRFFTIKRLLAPSSSFDTGCFQIFLFRHTSCRIFPIIYFPYFTPSLIPTMLSRVACSYHKRFPPFFYKKKSTFSASFGFFEEHTCSQGSGYLQFSYKLTVRFIV
jgi:hypothetical protein